MQDKHWYDNVIVYLPRSIFTQNLSHIYSDPAMSSTCGFRARHSHTHTAHSCRPIWLLRGLRRSLALLSTMTMNLLDRSSDRSIDCWANLATSRALAYKYNESRYRTWMCNARKPARTAGAAGTTTHSTVASSLVAKANQKQDYPIPCGQLKSSCTYPTYSQIFNTCPCGLQLFMVMCQWTSEIYGMCRRSPVGNKLLCKCN